MSSTATTPQPEMLWCTCKAISSVTTWSGQKRSNWCVWEHMFSWLWMWFAKTGPWVYTGKRYSFIQCFWADVRGTGCNVAVILICSQRIRAHFLTILLIIIVFCFTAPLWTVLSMTYNCFSCLTQWVWGSSWIVRSQRCFIKLEIKRSGGILAGYCVIMSKVWAVFMGRYEDCIMKVGDFGL